MNRTESLEHGCFYHIYNRGIDGCNLFREITNYGYFFNLYLKHVDPIADTYAWVLMKNHFHFLLRIKDPEDLPDCIDKKGHMCKHPHQYFSNLFNAYTKAFNKKYSRTGSLFEKNFHRKRIATEDYLRQVILYIHHNPVHHGFCDDPSEYPWSSYLSCISVKPTHLRREAVIGWFDNLGNFKYCHEKKVEIDRIEKWLEV
jgi:REP element-mobilizing transposase RayT